MSRLAGPAVALLLAVLGLVAWIALGGARPNALGGPGALDAQQLEGSSYEDGPRGSSDLFRMLGRTQGRVERWTRPLTQLPPGGTLVVFAPATTMHLEEQRQLRLHAEAGGTVLLVADELPELLELEGLALRQVPLPAASRPQVPSPLVDPTAPLESRGMALLASAEGVLSLYGSAHGSRVATVAAGQGRLLVVTDPFILSNEGIRATATCASPGAWPTPCPARSASTSATTASSPGGARWPTPAPEAWPPPWSWPACWPCSACGASPHAPSPPRRPCRPTLAASPP